MQLAGFVGCPGGYGVGAMMAKSPQLASDFGFSQMVDDVLDGFPEGGAAGEDNEGADGDEHGTGGQFTGQAGGDGGGDGAAGDETCDVEEGDTVEQDEKGDGAGEDDEEFGEADGADHIAGILSFGNE